MSMVAIKQVIYDLLDNIPESQLIEVADFIAFIKKKNENQMFKELELASVSSIDFWDNAIDDEVWNNV